MSLEEPGLEEGETPAARGCQEGHRGQWRVCVLVPRCVSPGRKCLLGIELLPRVRDLGKDGWQVPGRPQCTPSPRGVLSASPPPGRVFSDEQQTSPHGLNSMESRCQLDKWEALARPVPPFSQLNPPSRPIPAQSSHGDPVTALPDHGRRHAVPRPNHLSKLEPFSRNKIRPF